MSATIFIHYIISGHSSYRYRQSSMKITNKFILCHNTSEQFNRNITVEIKRFSGQCNWLLKSAYITVARVEAHRAGRVGDTRRDLCGTAARARPRPFINMLMPILEQGSGYSHWVTGGTGCSALEVTRIFKAVRIARASSDNKTLLRHQMS